MHFTRDKTREKTEREKRERENPEREPRERGILRKIVVQERGAKKEESTALDIGDWGHWPTSKSSNTNHTIKNRFRYNRGRSCLVLT